MLGVVVWSNETKSKAVIWCEDQGALAYLEGVENLSAGGNWPIAGDLIELESVLDGGLRLARNVRLLSQGAGVALPQVLREQVAEAGKDGDEVGNSDADSGKDSRTGTPHLRLVSACDSPQSLSDESRRRRIVAAS